MTTFQQRALTATVFAAVMLTGLFWNDISFNILFYIIMIGCLWEYWRLMVENGIIQTIEKIICLILISGYVYTQNYSVIPGWNSTILPFDIGLISLIAVSITFIFLILELFAKSDKPYQNISAFLFSFFYIAVPINLLKGLCLMGFAPQNTDLSFSPNIVAGILFLTWANDTFAYLVGSRIGKTPLLPRISPKKTWEGTIGGAVMCILTGIVISFFFKELPLRDWAVVGGIVAIFGTIGDLVESMLKRSVGVKDSGSFMPGHGGFLDRFDAFIFAIPFVFLYLVLIK